MTAEAIDDRADADEERDALAVTRAMRSHKKAAVEAGLELPPRPPIHPQVEGTRWHDRAGCRVATDAEADEMAGARYQSEGGRLATLYCETCPVARACLVSARRGHGWGVAGGIVMVHGYVAVERDQSAGRPRTLEAVQTLEAPEVAEELDASQESTTAVSGGQRWQPRRHTRRQRRPEGGPRTGVSPHGR